MAMVSLLATAADCAGLLICPFTLLCPLLAFVQLMLLLLLQVVAMQPEQLAHLRGSPESAVPVPAASHEVNLPLGSAPSERAPDPQHEGALGGASDASAGLPAAPDLRGRSRLSVVLACADEGDYAVKTALKVVERTTPDILEEVVIVDDGSYRSMEAAFDQAGVSAAERLARRIRILRHPNTMGLMVAKKTGGDAAKGNIIVFFDCHVSPQPNWHVEIRRLIEENPRRMVVPAITDLDLDTWEETTNSNVNTKCYLTWGAEFDWFNDDSPYVPVMSGGLLALSSYWWGLTGGYDGSMRGWGGENLDQSLRSWLCGGEIMRAPSSRVAHMWRTGDARTRAHYRGVGSVGTNKLRVVAAWYGPFKVMYHRATGQRVPDSFDISDIQRVQKRLGCKPLVHFLHHFQDIYVHGAVIAPRVFQLQDRSSGQCLSLRGGSLALDACDAGGPSRNGPQLFHWANRAQGARRCCSGLRRWGTDKCLDFVDGNGRVNVYPCDITGSNGNQQYRRGPEGRIEHGDGRCLARRPEGLPGLVPCAGLGEGGRWQEINAFEPEEAKLYREQLRQEGITDDALQEYQLQPGAF
mmetsp:Transcript_23111/g.72744  ORF Transcript_23111/g.72744 Transcript_23111/m.72744 type:complete len:580 (+) Transcript_23111:123-1862(+)